MSVTDPLHAIERPDPQQRVELAPPYDSVNHQWSATIAALIAQGVVNTEAEAVERLTRGEKLVVECGVYNAATWRDLLMSGEAV